MRRAIAATVAFALPVYYALNGGSYDLLVRHEEGLAIWALIGLGFLIGFLPRSRLPRAALVPLVGLAGLAVLMLISLAWTESDERTVQELARVVHYAGLVLLTVWALNRHTAKAAAAGLTLGALFICAMAVGSRIAPGTFPADQVAELLDSNRLSYPLDYWNATAAWGAMSIAGALALSAHLRQPLFRALFLAGVPFAALATYLSYSRAGVIGVTVAVVSVLVLSRNRWTALLHAVVAGGGAGLVIAIARSQPAIAQGTGGHGGPEVLGALAIAAGVCAGVAMVTRLARVDRIRMPSPAAPAALATGAIVVLGLIVVAGQGPIAKAWDEFKNQPTVQLGPGSDPAARLTQAGGSRYDVWQSALDAFDAHPLSGTGPGTFEFWWSRTQPNPEYLRDAHSLYIEQLAELGLPGFALILIFLGGLGYAGVRARNRARRSSEAGVIAAMLSMFAVYLVHAGVDWMWELTAVSALGIGAGGIAVAAGNHRRAHRPPIRLRAAGVALAVVALMVQIPSLVTTSRTRDSEAALGTGDLNGARELADQAVDAAPWSATPYMQRAAVAEADGRLEDARADLLTAIDNEPTDWRQRALLAQVELERGDLSAARAAFAESQRLHPSRRYPNFASFRFQVIGGSPPTAPGAQAPPAAAPPPSAG